MQNKTTLRLAIAALLIAIDVVTSPLFRIEGMAPMSSVLNVIIGCLVGPFYAFAITLMTGIIRMLILGIPPLALTGAGFGGVLSALFYRWTNRVGGAWLGEIIGTGIIGSLLSYPVMILFTGSSNGLYWFIYTPRFLAATLFGGLVGTILTKILLKSPRFLRYQQLFSKLKL